MSSNDMIPPPLTPQTKWLTLVQQLADACVERGIKCENLFVHIETTMKEGGGEVRNTYADGQDATQMAYWLRKDVERELERRRR